MLDVTKQDLDSARILEHEDAATLAAIDKGIRAASEGRVVPLEEVRKRLSQWPTESFLPKTR